MISLLIESTNKIVLFHKYCLGFGGHSSLQSMLPLFAQLPHLLSLASSCMRKKEAESKVEEITGLVLLCL